MDQHLEALPQRGAASEAAAVRICARAFLVHDAADRRAGRGNASALADRMGRRRPPAVLVGLSALGLRRSALRLQDAADGSRAGERSSTATPARSTSSDHEPDEPVTSSPARREIPPGGNKVVDVEGRDIVVFHVNGEFFALLNRCPHAGAPLDKAACVARLTSPEPGRLPALAGRRIPALRLARLGVRHAHRAILVRPAAGQDPDLSGRRSRTARRWPRVPMWPRRSRCMSRTATSSSRSTNNAAVRGLMVRDARRCRALHHED